MTGNDVPRWNWGNTHIQPLTSTFFSTLEKNFLPFRYDSQDNVFFLLGLLKGFFVFEFSFQGILEENSHFEFSFLNFEFRKRIFIYDFHGRFAFLSKFSMLRPRYKM